MNLRRFRLNNGRKLASGLSSYRATFNNHIKRMTNMSERLTDEQWAAILAQFLLAWFAFEEELLTEDSDSLIKILKDRDLL